MAAELCVTCCAPGPHDEALCQANLQSLAIAPTHVADPLIGQRAGDYVIEQLIGHGGMGLVYRGIHPEISKRVAIKVLRPREDDGADDDAPRLRGEAQLVTAIRHRSYPRGYRVDRLGAAAAHMSPPAR